MRTGTPWFRHWSNHYHRAGRKLFSHGKNHLFLAISILAYVVLPPYLQDSFMEGVVLSLLVSVVLIAAVSTIAGRRRFTFIATIVLLLTLLAQWGYLVNQATGLLILDRTLWIVLITMVVFVLLRDVIQVQPPVPKEILWSAVSLYMLIGFMWAIIFSIVEIVVPGSFMNNVEPGSALSDHDLIYFSFVTLGTLGYGDIIPATAQAKSLVIVEIINGVLYVAILISLFINKISK